jgi:hypothetical protein
VSSLWGTVNIIAVFPRARVRARDTTSVRPVGRLLSRDREEAAGLWPRSLLVPLSSAERSPRELGTELRPLGP